MANFSGITGPFTARLEAQKEQADILAKYASIAAQQANTQFSAAASQRANLEESVKMQSRQAEQEAAKAAAGELTPEDKLAKISQGLLDRGQMGDAMKAFDLLDRYRGEKAKVAEIESIQKERAANSQIKMMQTVGTLAGGVTDENGWKMAGDAFAQMFGQKHPLFDMPYNPELIKNIQTYAPIFNERMKNDIALQRLELAKRTQEDREKHYEDLKTFYEKNGSKEKAIATKRIAAGVKTPSKIELELAGNKLKSQGVVDQISRDFIASEAKTLQAQHPEWGYERAVEEAISNNPDRVNLGKKLTYSKKLARETKTTEEDVASRLSVGTINRGKTPATATQLPLNPSKDNLVVGTYYKVNYKGQVIAAKWNGSKLEY